MTIETGRSIGHYRVISRIGAGGMGEVYRGFDSRLDREVAIKLLPADLAKHPDRLERFALEAKATSARGSLGVDGPKKEPGRSER